MIDFEPVLTAGLGPRDLAKLCKVGRVSCSRWLNGHAQPHTLLTDRVSKVVDAIAAAYEAGRLPVPPQVMTRERAHYIETALRQPTASPTGL